MIFFLENSKSQTKDFSWVFTREGHKYKDKTVYRLIPIKATVLKFICQECDFSLDFVFFTLKE